MKKLYFDFVEKLKKLYGKFDDCNKRFEQRSNSEISGELGYSNAQFSRLINETATEGEYQRAIQNLERIIRVTQLEKQLEFIDKPVSDWWRSVIWLPLLIILIIVFGVLTWKNNQTHSINLIENNERDGTLKWTFENSFINPYSKLEDLPDNCEYPCYKYQGHWIMKTGYKIPFFRERNGFHYLATEVNMYARCMNEESATGDVFEGYEYQKHEIWYDLYELPLDSFTIGENRQEDFYQDMDFNQIDNFIKVATVHTFFRNVFTIENNLIQREGKVIGRDLELEDKEFLANHLDDLELVNNIQNEITRIAGNRLEDFSRPISCNPSVVPDTDFHNIKDGAKMSFNCLMTTNRVSFHYTKTFILEDQYIKNKCQNSLN